MSARNGVSIAVFVFLCWGTAAAQTLTTVPHSGEAPIGYLNFVVEAGADELTPEPRDRRRLLVETWFPAQSSGTRRKPWASGAMGAALSGSFPFPKGFHSNIGTHTWLDARPVATAMPAIVFSHGLSFPPTLYQSFFEDLASRGYAVFAVSHPHGAALIEYPDGASLDMSRWPRVSIEVERQRMLARAGDEWAADLSAVIAAIRAGRIPAGLTVDRSRVAVAGHSLGGTAAGKLSRDTTLAAVAVMEGEVRETDAADSRGSVQVAVPLLHLVGGYNRLELERASYTPGRHAPVITAIVNGTGHAYFSDLIHFYRAYADRAWRTRHRYEVDPDRVIRIASDYMAAFFDWQVKDGSKSVLLGQPSYGARVEGPQQAGYVEVDVTIAIQ
ncbi:MAG: hypothetical protein WD802_05175 [Gemmatimonadaceae bacterium]